MYLVLFLAYMWDMMTGDEVEMNVAKHPLSNIQEQY